MRESRNISTLEYGVYSIGGNQSSLHSIRIFVCKYIIIMLRAKYKYLSQWR